MKMEELLAASKELLAAPEVACKLHQLLKSSPFNEEIVEVVKWDVALTARILRVCNTAMFRGSSEITSLEDAVRRLGFQNILRMVWQISLGDTMQGSLIIYKMETGTFWRHAVTTAIAAEELWKLTERVEEDKPTVFTAGLLHDIGKILINEALKPKPLALLEYSCQEKLPLLDSERQLCSYDHAEIGGTLLADWNLPAVLRHGIMYHHRPELFLESRLPCLLHLADVCSHVLGEAYGWKASEIPLNPDAFAFLGIVPRDLEQVMLNLHQRAQEIEGMICTQV